MKHKAFTFWQAAVLLAAIVVLATLILPVFERRRAEGYTAQCYRGLGTISLALSGYTQDHDGRYPLVSSNQMGWSDALRPYLNRRQQFRCPAVGGDKDAPVSDYFYNARLVGMAYGDPQSKVDLEYPEWTIVLGDGPAAGPTDSNFRALPESWRTDPASPAKRHMGRANYLFGDGSLRALKPDAIDDGERRKANDRASFAVD